MNNFKQPEELKHRLGSRQYSDQIDRLNGVYRAAKPPLIPSILSIFT